MPTFNVRDGRFVKQLATSVSLPDHQKVANHAASKGMTISELLHGWIAPKIAEINLSNSQAHEEE